MWGCRFCLALSVALWFSFFCLSLPFMAKKFFNFHSFLWFMVCFIFADFQCSTLPSHADSLGIRRSASHFVSVARLFLMRTIYYFLFVIYCCTGAALLFSIMTYQKTAWLEGHFCLGGDLCVFQTQVFLFGLRKCHSLFAHKKSWTLFYNCKKNCLTHP